MVEGLPACIKPWLKAQVQRKKRKGEKGEMEEENKNNIFANPWY